MFKYTVIVTPFFASKMLRINMREFLNEKVIDGVKYSIGIWQGYSVDGNSINIQIESENDLSKTNYNLQGLNDFFEQDIILNSELNYKLSNLPIVITLMEG